MKQVVLIEFTGGRKLIYRCQRRFRIFGHRERHSPDSTK